MTWVTVAQALVLAVGAGAVSRWMAREPSPRRMTARAASQLLDAPPPRGHRYDVAVYSARCTCGWSFVGGVSVTSRRLRREVGRHLETVAAEPDPAPKPQPVAVYTASAGSQRYYLPQRYLGDPSRYCGKGMCSLGHGHQGACNV